MTPARPGETPADIAARYNARLHPDATYTVCPPHTYAEVATGIDPNPMRRAMRAAAQRNVRRRTLSKSDATLARLQALADGTRTRAEVAATLGLGLNTASKYAYMLRKKGVDARFRRSTLFGAST